MKSHPEHERATGAELHLQSFDVPFAYPVQFTHDAFDPANDTLAALLRQAWEGGGRLRLYVDAGLVAAQADLRERIRAWFATRFPRRTVEPAMPVPGGEAAKNGMATALRVVEDMKTHRLCRHSVALVLGGGAVLDAVGFAAALVHRGLRLVRLPSTTLAQGDVGVGVKNGVNLDGGKNFLGTFAPPFAVLNDFALLRSLPRDLVLDGIAEAFKVALIKDADFFAYLEAHAAALRGCAWPAVEEAVRRSALLHLEHIRSAGDPFETGRSRPLDFGHWSAHRLESLSAYRLRHGEAVGIGIALDTYYAWRVGYLREKERDRILRALRGSGLAIHHPLLEEEDQGGALHVFRGLDEFREHLGGELTVTLPRGIGRRIEIHEMRRPVLREGIAFLRRLAQTP